METPMRAPNPAKAVSAVGTSVTELCRATKAALGATSAALVVVAAVVVAEVMVVVVVVAGIAVVLVVVSASMATTLSMTCFSDALSASWCWKAWASQSRASVIPASKA